VCDDAGAKLIDPKGIAALKTALVAVLQAEDAAPPKRRLERARASIAR